MGLYHFDDPQIHFFVQKVGYIYIKMPINQDMLVKKIIKILYYLQIKIDKIK